MNQSNEKEMVYISNNNMNVRKDPASINERNNKLLAV
jgi:hypothetical protein